MAWKSCMRFAVVSAGRDKTGEEGEGLRTGRMTGVVSS